MITVAFCVGLTAIWFMRPQPKHAASDVAETGFSRLPSTDSKAKAGSPKLSPQTATLQPVQASTDSGQAGAGAGAGESARAAFDELRAASDGDIQAKYHSNGTVRQLTGNPIIALSTTKNSALEAEKFLKKYGKTLFGVDAVQFNKQNEMPAIDDKTVKVAVYDFQQMHAGLPVYNRSVKVVSRSDQGILQVNSAAEQIPADFQPVRNVGRDEAARKVWARMQVLAGPTEIKFTKAQVLESSEEFVLATAGKAALVYRFLVAINGQIGDYEFMIDARDGAFRREKKVSIGR